MDFVNELYNIRTHVGLYSNLFVLLLSVDNLDPFHYLDHKERGSNAVTDGRLVWNVPENCIKGK